jgi:YVTN family beta-propeller protein
LHLLCPSASFAGPFAYITNESLDRVTVVDTATHQVTTTMIDVGSYPTALAIRPDGRFVQSSLTRVLRRRYE